MPPALLQQNVATALNEAASLTCAFPGNVTAGSCIIAVVTINYNDATLSFVNGVSDSLNGAYVLTGPAGFSGFDNSIKSWRKLNSVGGACTITVAFGSNPAREITLAIYEYSDIVAASDLDWVAPAAAGGYNSTPAVASTATNTDGDLIFAYMATRNSYSPAAGAGFGIQSTHIGQQNAFLYAEDMIQALHGAIAPTWGSIATEWVVGALALKAAAAAGAGVVPRWHLIGEQTKLIGAGGLVG